MKDRIIVAGYVFSKETKKPIEYTNIYVKHRREGTISDTSGYFILTLKMYDTLCFAAMGYEKQYTYIDEEVCDRNEPLMIYLPTKAYMLPNVDIYEWRYQQLKYEVEHMELPDDDYVYANKNFPVKQAAISYYNNSAPKEGVGFSFSPITMLYDAFSKEGKEKRKLAELKEKDYRDSLVSARIKTEQIMELTGFSEVETYQFLDWCNFMPEFINSITSYEFIKVLEHKAEQYRVIKKGQKLPDGKIYLE